MKGIMFENRRFGLQDLVENGIKTHTVRDFKVPGTWHGKDVEAFSVCHDSQGLYTEVELCDGDGAQLEWHYGELAYLNPPYSVGEIVAIKESYKDAGYNPDDILWYDAEENRPIFAKETKGWENKMFVRNELMKKHIRITSLDAFKIQSIPRDRMLREGILYEKGAGYSHRLKDGKVSFPTPFEAYESLIGKLNGKAYWNGNPYVWGFGFEYLGVGNF